MKDSINDTMNVSERSILANTILVLYILLVGPFSVLLFLYGFLPVKDYDNAIATKQSIPRSIENIRLKVDELYQPVAKRVIIMVIDALRWDFIAEPNEQAAMPITSNLIANSSACLFRAKVQMPTVTMPRIKAMTTGTVPSFIDVVLNLGSKPVSGDSVLHQAISHDHKLIFYGDDTWLNLFPNLFERYDGTTSFFVTDFTEVDNNVTRHIHKELHNNDWSVMILHYLGLDHIGHVKGPFDPLIKVKLKEMDNVIAQIQSRVQYWNQNEDSSLFIICGDHGMKDSGGHGGSTFSEVTVPFITIGAKCPEASRRVIDIAQVDMAATLSVVLGIPIPYTNVGNVVLDTLDHLPDSRKLYILYYNAQQILHHFLKLPDYQSQTAYRKYQNALKLHLAWLNTNVQPNDMVDDIIRTYRAALVGMKDVLITNMDKYNVHVMTAAFILLLQIFCILIGAWSKSPVTLRAICLFLVLNIVLWMTLNYLCDLESTTVYFTDSHLLNLSVIVISVINSCIMGRMKRLDIFLYKVTPNKILHWTFFSATIMHTISFTGSSFIEEEHQTWYFFWCSLLTILFLKKSSDIVKQWPCISKVKACAELVLLLITHRILRKLNSTGNKYAHLSDISGWFKQQENNISMTLLVLIALGLLIWIAFIFEDTQYKRLHLIFNVIIAVCIYLRHTVNGSVLRIPFYPSSRGIYEVQVFWIILIIFVTYRAVRLAAIVKYRKTDFLAHVTLLVIQVWIMISAMLHQPYNIILLPTQIISTYLVSATLNNIHSPLVSMFIYSWSGNVHYFYQGNSNSLATIDVAAGYVGLDSYIPTITGLFLIVNTYSAPVLAYFTFVYYETLKKQWTCSELLSMSKIYLAGRMLPLAVYTIIITFQRHHLFVWSVFSPKLLYEAVYFVVICLAVLSTLVAIVLQNVITEYVDYSVKKF